MQNKAFDDVAHPFAIVPSPGDHPALRPLQLGRHTLANRLFVAPMAGVTDRPFRQLCRRLGAGYAVSEMLTSRPDLLASAKTQRRANHEGEAAPIAVQILGTDPAEMAAAALHNIAHGAHIIDINLGCPAKKVCNKWAGSALMSNPPLAVAIAQAVVRACEPHGVPVTLKMRTGADAAQRNAPELARAFEGVGIAMLTVHGRTREQGYRGQAEYETVAAVKAAVRVPVVVNGDIDSAAQAQAALDASGADALMIGRAAQGRPWLFREIAQRFATGCDAPGPLVAEVRGWLLEHLDDHYRLWGEAAGVRSARKHIGWYVRDLPDGAALRQRINAIEDAASQRAAVDAYFQQLGQNMERLQPLMGAPTGQRERPSVRG